MEYECRMKATGPALTTWRNHQQWHSGLPQTRKQLIDPLQELTELKLHVSTEVETIGKGSSPEKLNKEQCSQRIAVGMTLGSTG